jgi:hypothetical protein
MRAKRANARPDGVRDVRGGAILVFIAGIPVDSRFRTLKVRIGVCRAKRMHKRILMAFDEAFAVPNAFGENERSDSMCGAGHEPAPT